jgi:hypothetical protein
MPWLRGKNCRELAPAGMPQAEFLDNGQRWADKSASMRSAVDIGRERSAEAGT